VRCTYPDELETPALMEEGGEERMEMGNPQFLDPVPPLLVTV